MAASNHNEEQRQRTSAKIRALAQSILSGELGVVEGSRHLAKLGFEVGAEDDPRFIFFVGVDSETDHLPLGEVRHHWSPDALLAKDEELKSFEISVRERAFEICRSLIDKYDIKIR